MLRVVILEKMKREEDVVLGNLDSFWSSKVAPKARKELRNLKEYCSSGDVSSIETLKKRCRFVQTLIE